MSKFRCEHCDGYFRPHVLDEHHIKEKNEFKDSEKHLMDRPSNKIILCKNCHADAGKGIISRSELREDKRRKPLGGESVL